MASAVLKEQLKGLVQTMYNEGVLDHQFAQLQALQDAENPGFVAEVIALFCQDSERILIELSRYLDQPVVDFQKIDAYVHQLKGSSSSIGAQCIKLACIDFRQACDNNNTDGCIRALNRIKHEYCHLRTKFETIVQLEQKILAYDTIPNSNDD